jgi:acetyl-CoA synthetase
MTRWVWEPSAEVIERSNVYRMTRKYGFRDYADFWRRSVEDVAWFWQVMERELDLVWQKPYERVLDTSQGWAWARWFIGGRFNLTYNCLDKHVAAGRSSKVAFIWEGEDGRTERWTYGDLTRWTLQVSHALKDLGLRPGDRVGLFLPMVPEIVPALLAVARLGGIVVPMFSGYGPDPVAVRLRDSEARFLITADGFYRRGQFIPMKETADAALAMAPTVERVLVVRRTDRTVPWDPRRDVEWHEVVDSAPDTPLMEETEPETPFMLIYTSGTTGRPKATVHVHAGFPVKSAQDIYHCFDLQADDVLFWLTDMGWMMGPWEVTGVLLLGGTFLLYDGAPDYPAPDRLWQIVERHGVTILGITPTFIRAILRQGDEWVERHPMPTLRILGSTGEPWNPDPWMWCFEKVGKRRCPIINYSGGTEVSGGILGCVPVLPLKPCAFHGPVPGMDADVWDEAGRSVTGSVGELVVKKPWVGMTRGFWRDPQRYLETYWSRWPDVWVHGDLVLRDAEGFWFIEGRSDDTLKVGGKRLGPAEVESILVAQGAVAEAAVVGVPDEVKGEALVCFVVLKPGVTPSEELRQELKEWVARHLGKAFTPKDVRFVRDLPKTRNAKVMRRLIRAAYLGLPLGDTSSLENPQALEEIARISRE